MKKLILSLITLILLLTQSVSYASEANNCIIKKYKEYTEAKELWQHRITDIIDNHYPNLSSVARIYKHDQLANIESNMVAVELLALETPTSLQTENHLNQWLDIEEGRKQKLIQQSSRYKELYEIKQQAKKRINNKDSDKLREVMRENVMLLPEFKKAISDLNNKITKLEEVPCYEQ